MEAGKCSKIRCIVRLRQMLRRWRNKARMSSANGVPLDVPPGHVAVRVGRDCVRRHVMKASYLNHPFFNKLLSQVEEEYGFSNTGPLSIPCDEETFQEVLRFVSRADSGKSARFRNLDEFHRYCHEGLRNNLEVWQECRPLLHGFTSAQ
ncbi:auxin-induced protein 6B-like [Neltuma alba]|uniref:auxin-induced protein 6B-like n=1 Tax=Neltuma alba TaxID=207710 RepID=UPI0010A3F706|nr:auxin-induced protein 6B-like [Prosopis alba]